MKRVITILAVLIAVASASAWSQAVQIGSLEAAVSQGIFINPIDAAFSVSGFDPETSFAALKNSYWVAGLENLSLFTAVTPPMTATPLVGYYATGGTPWSVFIRPSVSATPTTLSNNTVVNTLTGPVTVTSGTTDTDYFWIARTTGTTYAFFDQTAVDLSGQLLIGLGSLNTGLFARWTSAQNVTVLPIATWAGNNSTEVQTNNYNTAVAGAVPTPVLDYTRTTVRSAPDSSSVLSIGLPMYIGFGNAGLAAVLMGIVSQRDQSMSVKRTYSVPAQAGVVSFNNVQDDVSTVDKTGSYTFNLNTGLKLPSILGAHRLNRLELMLGGSLVLNTADPQEVKSNISSYQYPGAGGAATVTARTYDDTISTRQGFMGYSANFGLRHLLYLDIGDSMILGLAPVAAAAVMSTPSSANYTTQSVQVVQVDNDADGAFTSAADRITTTTTVFTYTNDGIPFDISFTAALPAALKTRLKDWPFGFTIGSTLSAGCTVRTLADFAQRTDTTQIVKDGTGAQVGQQTVTPAWTSFQSSSTNTMWSFTAAYNLGLNIFLPGNATIDVTLNGSNLLVFDNLSLQTVIPLP